MFLNFYGLRDQPFGLTPDPRYLYPTLTHREALASLSYGVAAGRGFLALIAQPGMGKTTLLYQLLERLQKSACTAFLFQTQCTSRELLKYILLEMGLDTCRGDAVAMHQQLNQALLRARDDGKRSVLVIDEAQNLEPSVLETVRLLSDFESPEAKLLQIILAGQPELERKLADPSLIQLRQRISIVARLEPFGFAETCGYIDHRLRVAGHTGPSMFTSEALGLITRCSQGTPRVVNNLCFNALSLGYALGQKTIDSAIVQEVVADLQIGGSAPRSAAPLAVAKTDRPTSTRARSNRVWRRMAVAAMGFVLLVASSFGTGSKPVALSSGNPQGSLKRILSSVPLLDRAADHFSTAKLPPKNLDRGAATPPSPQAAATHDAGSGGSPPSSVRSITVQPQQTLWQISRKYAGRQSWKVVSEICALNPDIADPNRIVSGQKINLPIRKAASNTPGSPDRN